MNLQAAIAAVRDESVERGTAELMTRRRVLASIERSPSRRLHAVVAAVIASMFGASAFAWYVRAPAAATTPVIVQEANVVTSHEPVAVAPARIAMHIVPAVEVEPVVVVEERAARPEAVTSQPAVAEPVVPSDARPDPDLALYATAHRLHFQDRDLLAAVAAWDRYLAAAPAGKLAPEARFNRVVALVRLERWDDAERALDEIDRAFRPADVAKLRALVLSSRQRR